MRNSSRANANRWCPRGGGRLLGAALLLACVLGMPRGAHAQLQDSFVDTLYIDTVLVPDGSYDAGDTIWVGLGVVNTFTLGAINYRLQLPDTLRIRPAFSNAGGGNFPVQLRLVGRGLSFNKSAALNSAQVVSADTTNVITGLLADFEGTATIPTGRGTIIQLAMIAKSAALHGDTSRILVADDLSHPIEPRNNLSDVTGTLSVAPRLRAGLIRYGVAPIDTGGSQQGAPAISFTPNQTVYSIKQGQTVNFTVTATDPDTTNDQVTLSASLPSGATLAPSNPIVGTKTVSGTFEWTPNFSQEGGFNVTFSATDNHGKSSSRTVSITVEKQDIDILFTLSAENAKPRGGIPGKTPVLVPIDVLASRDIFGLQFDLVLDGSVFRVDSLIPTSKLTNFTVFDNIGTNPDTIRVITFSVTGDSIPLASGSTILELAVSVDSLAAAGRYPLTFAHAFESITPDPEVKSIDMVVQNGVLDVDHLGDVNLDLRVDVADMVSLTSYILGRTSLDDRRLDVADVNVDAAANVIDLVSIINYVLGLAPLTAPSIPIYTGGEAELNLVYGGQVGDVATYYLDGYMPTDVAGMQLQFSYDAAMLDPYVPSHGGDAGGLSVQSVRDNGQMSVVAYYNSDASNAVHAGDGRFLVLPVKVKQAWADPEHPPLVLESAVLADPKAAKVPVKGTGGGGVLPTGFELYQNYPNPFNPSTTIEFRLDGGQAEHVVLDVFNILGQHVATPVDDYLSPGDHRAVWNGTDRTGGSVASGVYFYRLRVGSDTQTRKMMLLK
jgi:hypothetical protein